MAWNYSKVPRPKEENAPAKHGRAKNPDGFATHPQFHDIQHISSTPNGAVRPRERISWRSWRKPRRWKEPAQKKESFRRGREAFFVVSRPKLEPRPKTIRDTIATKCRRLYATRRRQSELLLRLGRLLLLRRTLLARGFLCHGAFTSFLCLTNLVFAKKSVNEFFVVLSSFFALSALARIGAVSIESGFDAIRIAPRARVNAHDQREDGARAAKNNFCSEA